MRRERWTEGRRRLALISSYLLSPSLSLSMGHVFVGKPNKTTSSIKTPKVLSRNTTKKLFSSTACSHTHAYTHIQSLVLANVMIGTYLRAHPSHFTTEPLRPRIQIFTM